MINTEVDKDDKITWLHQKIWWQNFLFIYKYSVENKLMVDRCFCYNVKRYIFHKFQNYTETNLTTSGFFAVTILFDQEMLTFLWRLCTHQFFRNSISLLSNFVIQNLLLNFCFISCCFIFAARAVGLSAITSSKIARFRSSKFCFCQDLLKNWAAKN